MCSWKSKYIDTKQGVLAKFTKPTFQLHRFLLLHNFWCYY